MSSALQLALTSLQQNNYVSIIVLTAVGYDYVLTFSDEIEYIWSKPWTWVSTLFILVRYCGFYSLLVPMLVGSSFLPGPAKASQRNWHLLNSCELMLVINSWTFILFLGATDFVMILRVWAMYNRSRVVLGTLLTLFSLEMISTIIAAGIDSNPKNLLAVTIQVLDFSFCVVEPIAPIWNNVDTIFQMTHGAVMCALAVIQFVRQSLQMYFVTKQWRLNRYMNLLLKEGVLYFFVILVFDLIIILADSRELPMGGWQMTLLLIVEYVPMYTLTSRFIVSMRRLYAHDLQGGRGVASGIDTAFGLSLSGRGAVGTEIIFADVGQNEGLEDAGEVPMEVMEIGTTQPK